MNILSVASRGIRDQLITHSSLATLLLESGSEYNIFLDTAPPNAEPPYVRITHQWGGDENANPKRSFDITFRVDGISRDYEEAEVLYTYIDEALNGSTPTLTDGWTAWTPVRQLFPLNDPINVGNEQFFSMGGQYRIRGV